MNVIRYSESEQLKLELQTLRTLAMHCWYLMTVHWWCLMAAAADEVCVVLFAHVYRVIRVPIRRGRRAAQLGCTPTHRGVSW